MREQFNWQDIDVIGWFEGIPILRKEFWLKNPVWSMETKKDYKYFFMEAGDDTVAWMLETMSAIYVGIVKKRTSSSKTN